jgi:hypothetical protein
VIILRMDRLGLSILLFSLRRGYYQDERW